MVFEDRRSELLEVPYFHVVFTDAGRGLPQSLSRTRRLSTSILFRTTAETLKTIAADPKHLGAEIGFFAPILHTVGDKTSQFHPHLHCVVPGRRTVA